MKRFLLIFTAISFLLALSSATALAGIRWSKPEAAFKKAKLRGNWVFVFVTNNDQNHKAFMALNLKSNFTSIITRSGCIPVLVNEEDKGSISFGKSPTFSWYNSNGDLIFTIQGIPAVLKAFYPAPGGPLMKGGAADGGIETLKVVECASRLETEATLAKEMITMYALYDRAKKSNNYTQVIAHLTKMKDPKTYAQFKRDPRLRKNAKTAQPNANDPLAQIRGTLSGENRCMEIAGDLLNDIAKEAKKLLKQAEKALSDKDFKKALATYGLISRAFSPLKDIAKHARSQAYEIGKNPEYQAELNKDRQKTNEQNNDEKSSEPKKAEKKAEKKKTAEEEDLWK